MPKKGKCQSHSTGDDGEASAPSGPRPTKLDSSDVAVLNQFIMLIITSNAIDVYNVGSMYNSFPTPSQILFIGPRQA